MSARTTGERIQSATGYLMLRVGDVARGLIEQALRKWDLTGKDLRVLAFASDRPTSQQELCQLSETDRTTMVAVVDKLEHLGYAERTRSATDRRKYLVTLTPMGRKTLRTAMNHLDRIEAGFLAPLTEAERGQLHDLIRRLYVAHDPTCLEQRAGGPASRTTPAEIAGAPAGERVTLG